MVRFARGLVTIIWILGLLGCSGGGVSISLDVPEGADSTADGSVVPDASTPPDALLPEVRWDVAAPDIAPDVTPEVEQPCEGPGCFGDPCAENTDCLSGFCILHLGDRICTSECVEECPEGFSCEQFGGAGRDLSFVCVSRYPSLCLPCAADSDCKSSAADSFQCAVYAGEGSFCAAPCDAGNPCPQGYLCQTVTLVSGATSQQCVREDGLCGCTAYATLQGLTTPCYEANENGQCDGLRTCSKEGLTECSAPVPAEEECNGIDDDCDEETDESVCDDGNPCTDDSCVPGQGCQHTALDGVECSDGDPCTVAELCKQGICSGTPVICNDNNPCTDDSCTEVGGCAFQNNQELCDDGEACTVGDHCLAGKCAGTPVSCECEADADCTALEDGNLCNGTLFCDMGKLPYLCSVKAGTPIDCPEPEGKDAFCLASSCNPDTGKCGMVPAHEGASCSDGDVCTVGDDCQEGKCLGQAAVCDDGNPCTTDSCEPGKGCVFKANSSSCNDGNACTDGDQCQGGACTGGAPVDCNDGNLCTTDSCHPLTGCDYVLNTAPCDDKSLCTVGDKCKDGACQSGKPVDCNDGNSCTEDSCNPVTGCQHLAGSGACDDLDPCTTGDYCSAGMCVGAAALECGDGNPCTDDWCVPMAGCNHKPNTAPCDDANPCTSGDKCGGGLCQAGAKVACNDSNPCTDDSCDPTKGCVFTFNTSPCDDDNLCTTGGTCKAGKCAGSGVLDCNDDNLCTTDSCDPQVGCIHTMNQVPCDDANLCTFGDHCDLGKCIGGGALTCKDGNPCTDDLCNPKAGCEFPPNTAGCDDGTVCTAVDVCANGLCKGTQPLVCDDANPCTSDWCDPALGCQHAPLQAACDDGNKCTGDDQCAAGQCKGGPAVSCDDSNGCTDDSCEPLAGCKHTPNTALCDDSNACTSGDKCEGGACKPGAAITCNDAKPCTTDTCEPATGCVYVPITPCCGNGVKEGTEECDDGNNVSSDGCSADCKSEFSGCQGGAQLLSTSPNSQMVVCFNGSTCEQDYESLCPSGWELCSQLQYSQRNDGWSYSTGGKMGLGAIRCRNGGGAGHYTIHTGNLGQDEGDNCHYGSSRPSCPSGYGCNEQGNLAVCCKHNPLCGNGKVDGSEEECDDGNKSNDDNCLNNCMSRYVAGCS